MTTSMFVDGRAAEPNGEGAYRIDVGPGLHLDPDRQHAAGQRVAVDAVVEPGADGFGRLSASDHRAPGRARSWSVACRWSAGQTTGLSAIFVIAWFVSALRAWGDVTTLAWAAAASLWLAYLAPRPGNDYVTSDLARWSVTALALAALLPIRDRSARCAARSS